ncbi:DNA cytosine methyltransferase [Deinococcus apachensis]|uniref:DNA cytosine methyltransferase n=1 Tax=Deinococcus apachensis TaxID=309886 RepID=UPI000372E223|nr:DNA cytosine methyltransferase [Deinococcus apachensis]
MNEAQGRPGSVEYLGVTPRSQRLTLLDLFAGAGGLSLGLTWAGFRSLAAVEVDPAAAATYDANFGGHILRDSRGRPLPMEQVDFTSFRGRVDLLSGGPPCQGFSLLGTRLEDDPRNRLWREFIRAVDEVQPRAFLMENVPPILKTQEGAFTIEHARELGYSVVAGVLSAEQFGVPQKRKRAFFLGVRDGAVSLPRPLPGTKFMTVRRAFAGLPLQPTNEDLHMGRTPTGTSLERYATVPEGGNRFDLMAKRPDITPRCWLEKATGSTDVFGRLHWDQPALTIRTEFYKPEKGRYLHPSEHRPITHREAARLQTFPDDFHFEGSKIEVARQIGNAVPPLLAYVIGLHLESALERRSVPTVQPTLFELVPG